MSSANIYLQNNTGSNADLVLCHWSSDFAPVYISGQNVPSGGSIGPMAVEWKTSTLADYWYASVGIPGGLMYVSYNPDDPIFPYWKEDMLMDIWWDKSRDDNGSHPTFTVDTSTFNVNLKSQAESTGMLNIGPYLGATNSGVSNIFVLMLENHSFDNIFAFSGISGIIAATTSNSNSYNGTTYNVSDSATPTSMPTDPGHEFADVVNQLCGYQVTSYTPPNYPAIDMSGFAGTYANSTDEQTGAPQPQDIGDIMACFNTQSQLPNIYSLANSYVICDQWFSSLPGPTWPNRYYVHGASSAYWNPLEQYYQSLDDSPSTAQMLAWEAGTPVKFTYERGSIYDALNNAGIPWTIYYDYESDSIPGSFPQVGSIDGVSLTGANARTLYGVELDGVTYNGMQDDLQSGYPYRYTFIEPNYGDIIHNTYEGGSSQHPMDDVSGGENLIANVCNWIFNSPVGPTSLLIITYDEHGGFYDSFPPVSTVPPNPLDQPGANSFVFNQLGVRVPAVVVSPFVYGVGVDHTVYDHSSVLATVEKLFGLTGPNVPLTARDEAAADLTHLLTSDINAMQTKRIPHLNAQRPRTPKPAMTPEELAARALEPLPEKGNLLGSLVVAEKTDMELSTGTAEEHAATRARVKTLRTRGDADAYMKEVMARVQAANVARAQAMKAAIAKPNPKSAMKQLPPSEESK